MKINKLIMVLFALLLVPSLTSAQNWVVDPTFGPAEGTDDAFSAIHGIAVDPDGKIWIQPFGSTERIVVNRDIGNDGIPDTLLTRALYVYNADGTPVDFSPLLVLEWADGTTPNDTLGRVWTGTEYEAYSGRGIETHTDGNIIISSFDRLYKVDYKTGQALAKVDTDLGGAITEATVDDEGNVYVGKVAATGSQILQYDSDLTAGSRSELISISSGFSRDLQVSPDGQTLWWAGYTGPGVLEFKKPDEFSGFGPADTVLRGTRVESFDIHPVTKHLWISAGSTSDVPSIAWTPQTWYAFDYATLGSDESRLDSIRWVSATQDPFDTGKPRALDFSPDGKIAYIGTFDNSDAVVDLQKFTTEQVFVSNENERANGVPEGFRLEQNYPNPFNPTTNIEFAINEPGQVSLKVYDLTGREVASLVNSRMSAGEYTVTFDASNLSSGVYVYILQTNNVRLTNRMTLIK